MTLLELAGTLVVASLAVYGWLTFFDRYLGPAVARVVEWITDRITRRRVTGGPER